METKNILKPLLEIGLSKYEAKVYLTLISEGITTAKNISDITGIPYGKVYEIINSLSYKGFAMILPTKPMKYRAISPQQAIITAKKSTHEKYEKLEKKIISQLTPIFAKNKNFIEPKSVLSIINGRSNIIKKIEELINKAKKNINIHCTENSLSRLTLHKEALKQAKQRGIGISIAGVINKENLEEISSLDFCNIKQIKTTENNLFSIDGKECMLINPMPDDDNIVYGHDIGAHIIGESFTKFLDNFFISNFKRAKQVNLSANSN